MERRVEFVSALLAPENAPPDGLVDFAEQPSPTRFNVYRNNVAVSLSEALETGFPVVRKLVGDRFFRAMAGAFVRTHPPSSPLMFLYGDRLAGFLEAFPPAQSLPYLPDTARLEYVRRMAYHAADCTPIAASALSALSPDDLMASTIQFAPSCHILQSRFPVLSIWRKNVSADPNPTKIEVGAENVLISRPRFDPELDALTAAEATVATRLIGGLTVSAALDGQAPDTFGSLLTKLLTRGCIHRLDQGGDAR